MEQRDAVTIRFPINLLSKARQIKSGRESLNEFVVEAVDREVRRRTGLQAFEEIVRLREQIKDQMGLQPDSGPLIRAMREGKGCSK